ncbi:cation:proton antiporter [candidate division KSB1 bacterium]|nr:monovalent cation/H(+) antiporter subunit G [bacterium]RKY78770.1 MAG: cation:proton antiporter [candidate division KSB1 bacterium]
MAVTGAIITLIGSLFLFLGSLGLVRMPDLYNRMQTGTKATTLGSILFLSGLAISQSEFINIDKTIVLILFIVFTNPISSHALARASHFIGIPLTEKTTVDRLAEDEGKE